MCCDAMPLGLAWRTFELCGQNTCPTMCASPRSGRTRRSELAKTRCMSSCAPGCHDWRWAPRHGWWCRRVLVPTRCSAGSTMNLRRLAPNARPLAKGFGCCSSRRGSWGVPRLRLRLRSGTRIFPLRTAQRAGMDRSKFRRGRRRCRIPTRLARRAPRVRHLRWETSARRAPRLARELASDGVPRLPPNSVWRALRRPRRCRN